MDIIFYGFMMYSLCLMSVESYLFMETVKFAFITQTIAVLITYYFLLASFQYHKENKSVEITIEQQSLKEHYMKFFEKD